MKDTEIDNHLKRLFLADPPSENFRRKVLADSLSEFLRLRRRRLTRRIATTAAAAVLIAGFAFLGGRLSVSNTSAAGNRNNDRKYIEPGSVSVPEELVAWLNAAQLFRRLGMQDRMSRSVDRAAKFLPDNTVTADNRDMSMFVADFDRTHDESVRSHGLQGPQPSRESINQILSQTVLMEIKK